MRRPFVSPLFTSARELLSNFLLYLGEPRFRSIVLQLLLLAGLVLLIREGVENALIQLERQNISTGFGFLFDISGFAVNQSFITYDSTSTYGRALLVGLLNTLIVAVLGIFFATLLGFMIGIGRLSSNWLISRLASVYVEIIRNIPLLLQIFFWYFAVFGSLPTPRDSVSLWDIFFVNRRGLYIPEAVFDSAMVWVVVIFILSLVGVFILKNMSDRHRQVTGESLPLLKWSLLLLCVPAPFIFLITGSPMHLEFAELAGFNFRGGIRITPEFAALLLALSTYTAAFIAEIVRSGILAVRRGQVEAGLALGLRRSLVLRKIIIPQSLRVIIPPLTSQYLNLTKNSSLAVAIAYPDLVSVFAGTVLNQTGQALEIIFITMSVYLILSLATSTAMNVYNRYLLGHGGVAG